MASRPGLEVDRSFLELPRARPFVHRSANVRARLDMAGPSVDISPWLVLLLLVVVVTFIVV